MSRIIFRTPDTAQSHGNTSADLLIEFIVGTASRLGNGVSRIRLIKFLYLADVHWFRKRSQRATTYRWRFYHYGPYTAEAQGDIDAAVSRGAIGTLTMPRDEGGDVTLYRATGIPDLSAVFDASFEALLSSEIRQWLWKPLPEFLNYVYFDTPPMRVARRGEYLRFEPELFRPAEAPPAPSVRRRTSQAARRAFASFLAKADQDRVPLPRDAIADASYLAALQVLDSDDILAAPLEGTAEANPDELSES
jgi:hypothetical protein